MPEVFDEEAFARRRNAWTKAQCRRPCDRCDGTHPQKHHATVTGENLCHDCFAEAGEAEQRFPGDSGANRRADPYEEVSE